MSAASDVVDAAPDRAPQVSVVVPVYRNRHTLLELLRRLDAALAGEAREYVFVVDASPDDSLALLLEAQRERPHLVVLELARNAGQHGALCAGFAAARGRVALVLDADLQQRPEDLPRALESWRAGHDFVSGWRRVRRDPLTRRVASAAMNALVRRVTGVALHDWGCPLAAVDRSVFERIPEGGEQRRFLKPLVASLSRNAMEIEIEADARTGASSYSPFMLCALALDFVVSFTRRPFQWLIGIGALGVLAGTLGAIVYFAARLFGASASDRAQVLVVLGLLVGLQLVVLGAVGEFTHRIYRLVQARPLYEVRAVHRADPK
ncbi:MAG: glycosyltransferase family 2 protein [Planctomycetes bacterium]|nr:glycosyltransferase family 2 protein [Planctomycetota bacterium]